MKLASETRLICFYSVMSVNHYENFPVASLLLPAHLRPAVRSIYAFARNADDIADEGQATAQQRLKKLEVYQSALDKIERGEAPECALFQQLEQTIKEYRLPITPFKNLLLAFKQDVCTNRYHHFTDLLDYCRHSASPIGILMLHLYNAATPQNLHDANTLCSALQLINFWQDVAIDWEKNRIYIPQEDLQRFNVLIEQFSTGLINQAWRQLMHFEIQRTRRMIFSSQALAFRLPGRIGWELRFVIQGGLRILEMLEARDYDMFLQRPTLGRSSYCLLFWRALRM